MNSLLKLKSLNKYKFENKKPKALYGLPPLVKFCKKCTYSNQKPISEKEFEHKAETKKTVLGLNHKGICSACIIAEKKNKIIDWKKRYSELKKICDKYRSRNGSYDCLVPGSGGKDSFVQAYRLKYEFGMNPLTITWAPHIYTDWGWQNFQSWIHSGFDNYLFTPNGKIHRLLTRLAIDNIFHPFQPFIMGQNHFPIKFAAKLKNIKLIFYGDPNSEYGNPDNFNSSSKPQYYFSYKKKEDDLKISGLSVRELKKKYNLTSGDLEPYLPINQNELNKSKIEVKYLGYYLKWHPQSCYYFASEKGNFTTSSQRNAGTYQKYAGIDDKVDDFHYYTTFIKFGIGRASYDAAIDIRNGEITRSEGVNLVKKFDGEYPERFQREVFKYLSIDKLNFNKLRGKFKHPEFNFDYFQNLTNRFRSPHIWYYDTKKRNWSLRNKIS
jgi:N-acetyl sugar amidotransferase